MKTVNSFKDIKSLFPQARPVVKTTPVRPVIVKSAFTGEIKPQGNWDGTEYMHRKAVTGLMIIREHN